MRRCDTSCWLVSTGVDDDVSWVGGTEARIRTILRSPDLERLRVDERQARGLA